MDSASSNERQNHCFQEWLDLQERDLNDLGEAVRFAVNHASGEEGSSSNANQSNGEDGNSNSDHQSDGQDINQGLQALIHRNIEHFQEYITKRNELAVNDVSPYLSPKWCSTFEGSMFWIGGCRPSMFIRLLYALIGHDAQARLEEYLQGKRTGRLGEVTADQMNMINDLQRNIIRKEDRLTARLIGLQEELGDDPIAIIANKDTTSIHEDCGEAEVALNHHGRGTEKLLEETDALRLNTIKDLTLNILNPVQAVEFLAASKKLHLCVRRWGGTRDTRNGRPLPDGQETPSPEPPEAANSSE